jgi:Tfp pilus assembly protein PilO
VNKEDLIKLKTAFIILGVGLLVFLLIMVSLFPKLKQIPQTTNDIKTQQQTLDDDNRKLQDMQNAEKQVEANADNTFKAFFNPGESGLDAEAALGLEFSELLASMRQNRIKTRSINYEYNPSDDNFVKNLPNKYQSCRVTMEMVAHYSDFENFLRELYKHPHFLEISKIEIAPYTKNKRILLINLQIKIYAQKDSSSAAGVGPTAAGAPAVSGSPLAPAAAPASPAAAGPSAPGSSHSGSVPMQPTNVESNR